MNGVFAAVGDCAADVGLEMGLDPAEGSEALDGRVELGTGVLVHPVKINAARRNAGTAVLGVAQHDCIAGLSFPGAHRTDGH